MPSEAEWNRRIRTTECESAIAKMMLAHDERDVAIWMAAFISQMKRLSDTMLLDDDDADEQP